MKKWIKQQLTELSAWAGIIMILGAYFFPPTAFVIIGILLIASDDEKATAFFNKVVDKISKEIDNA